MNKEFIPYEQALELKELGFDEVCFGFYNPRHEIGDLRANPLYEHTGGCFDNYNRTDYLVSVPLYQQAFRWFREKYGLYYIIQGIGGGLNYDFSINKGRVVSTALNYTPYPTYEEAELACLKKLIEIVKTK